MVADWSDEDIWWKLKRGGHDYRKVYAAYKAAIEHTGQPTVILAKTIKGYGLGRTFAGRNATHQMKKLTLDDLKTFRDSLQHPDHRRAARGATPTTPPYYHPGPDDEAIQYTLERRAQARRRRAAAPRRSTSTLQAARRLRPTRRSRRAPASSRSPRRWRSSGCSRTSCATRSSASAIVPIIPDEARTFGMDSFFSTIKIYNPHGQNYTPVDAELMLAYRESKDGQILHLGINEAGSMAAFTAVGTSLRHARRADDPDLRLLLDVRVPAHRRLDLGGRRPDDARLPHRRHGRSHHAHRRGPAARRRPLAAARLDEPGGRALRPGLLLRDRAHHAGRPAPDVRHRRLAHRRRAQRHLLPHRLQRADGAAGRARERRPRGHPARASTSTPRATTEGLADDAPRVQLLASGVGVPWALEAQELLRNDFGRGRPTCGR